MFWHLCLVFLVAISGCTRKPLNDRMEALRLASYDQELVDDLDLVPLLQAVEKQVALLEGSTPYPHPLVFGKKTYTPGEYAKGLRAFLEVAKTTNSRQQTLEWLTKWFDFYEVYGHPNWGDVFVTSYFEPVLKGSRIPTSRFSTALHARPKDLVDVEVEKFGDRFREIRQMRGKLEKNGEGHWKLVPYPDRKEIDENKALKKQGLELCYVDPIDAFTLHIQGSGTVQLDGGSELRVGYDGQNGHPYEAIGKYVESIPSKDITLINLEGYLRSLPSDQLPRFLAKNPSYIFFRKLSGPPLTFLKTEVVAGRTIATDTRYFPKGALAYLHFQKPKFIGPYLQAPVGYEPASRLVIDQDTGGAIRGGGRVDLFWGRGPEAKLNASVIKQPGQLFYLAPKKELLAQLEGVTQLSGRKSLGDKM